MVVTWWMVAFLRSEVDKSSCHCTCNLPHILGFVWMHASYLHAVCNCIIDNGENIRYRLYEVPGYFINTKHNPWCVTFTM